MENIREIYEKIADEESKKIFCDRLIYSLTADREYMRAIIGRTPEGKEMAERLSAVTRSVAIFGAGIWGREIVETYNNISFACFIDNKARNKEERYCGLPVVSLPQFMEQYADALIIISTRLYYNEIYKQLIENGVTEDRILNAGMLTDRMSKRQYFDLPELKNALCEDECFVDAGSFDGRTAILFTEWCGGKYSRIWAFEPDERNIAKCSMNLSEAGVRNFEVVNSGLWDRQCELAFSAEASGASKIENEGTMRIHTERMDERIKERVTFIKMDIEGSEYRALEGAEKLIREYRPKLAISVYHKPEDIWELPRLVLQMNPSYKLYFRHYSIAAAETVMYAL